MAHLTKPIEYEVKCPKCKWTVKGLHHSSEGLEEAKAMLLNTHKDLSHAKKEPVINEGTEDLVM